MNERIKQLAEQAGFFPTELTSVGPSVEKFAQLIIRECAEVCYDHSRAAGGVDTDFGYGYKDCGDDIKRNFGVEV
jgi:hypothetical protein